MPREKEFMRENLEAIKEKFPDKEILNITEAAIATGRCRKFVRRHFITGKEKYISVRKLASLMSN